MCCIAVCPPGVPAARLPLESILEVNDDGAGYGLVVPSPHSWNQRTGQPAGKTTLIYCKSLDAEFMLHQFLVLRREFPDGWAVFHARTATVGAVKVENCHPFHVYGDRERLLFHNGTLPESLRYDDKMSDTEQFAEERFWKGASLDNPEFRTWLDEIVAENDNKAVILTSRPDHAEHAYILNRSRWIEAPSGVLYSNSDFLGRGVGWAEETIDGDLWRWRVSPAGEKSALRNETERRARIAAAPR
jgi:glutamine amidotransferase